MRNTPTKVLMKSEIGNTRITEYLHPRSGENKPIVIEDNVWLGGNVMILKGVTIGRNTLIGAGSVVTKSIPANVIAAGNPCKVIRTLRDDVINELNA